MSYARSQLCVKAHNFTRNWNVQRENQRVKSWAKIPGVKSGIRNPMRKKEASFSFRNAQLLDAMTPTQRQVGGITHRHTPVSPVIDQRVNTITNVHAQRVLCQDCRKERTVRALEHGAIFGKSYYLE